MNRWLLNHLPTWGIMTLFVIGAMVFAYLAFRLVRRYFPDLGEGEQNEVATLSVEIIGAVYGIILGFVIVALWEGFNRADDNVSAEATSMSQIVRSALVFSPEAKKDVTASVGEYVHAVTDDEWDRMRDGRSSVRAADAIQSIYVALENYEPQTETQKTFYSEAVTRLNEGLSFRRTRLDRVDASIPGALQFMMYAGFVAIVGFMALMHSTRRRGQMIMLLGVTAMIAFILVLATTLDYPFSGDVAVSDEPFRSGALAQFYHE